MLEVDHIGIAVFELRPAVERWLLLLKGAPDAVEYKKIEHARMDIAYLNCGGTKIELMSPWDEESSIHRFLEKRGPGMHHICFRTCDISAEWKALKKEGVRIVDDEPRESEGELIGFLHPKGFDGVLIEFKES